MSPSGQEMHCIIKINTMVPKKLPKAIKTSSKLKLLERRQSCLFIY